ncbi:MAG TPA: 30S ribosomal protein S6 [Solirubrobacteraceae bacterium]|nr:30S ribosomal protein S6 [Solirubrobacteraceae bacterium]
MATAGTRSAAGVGHKPPAIVGRRPTGFLTMPSQPRLYDLVLVLSTTAEDDRRAKVLSDVEAQIAEAGGTVERQDDWQTRPMAYEIRHQKDGEYHLLQFTGPASLLETLSHNLRIDDAVLRFRIIKVLPGTPPPPDSAPPVLAATHAAAPQAAEE